MNPVNVTVWATLILSLAAMATWSAHDHGHGPRWLPTVTGIAAGAGCVLVLLLVACGGQFDIGSVKRSLPSARFVYQAGFYAGCVVLGVLFGAVLVLPWWLDRREAAATASLVASKKDERA